MESIGQCLKTARERKALSVSEAAAALSTKIQVIEDLEADRFESMAAPIYVRGFIRLYAELLGLDPQPLLDAYIRQTSAPPEQRRRRPRPPAGNDAVFLGKHRQQQQDPGHEPAAVEAARASEPLPASRGSAALRLNPRTLRAAAVVLGAAVLLWLAGYLFNRAVTASILSRAKAEWSLLRPVPPPYAP